MALAGELVSVAFGDFCFLFVVAIAALDLITS